MCDWLQLSQCYQISQRSQTDLKTCNTANTFWSWNLGAAARTSNTFVLNLLKQVPGLHSCVREKKQLKAANGTVFRDLVVQIRHRIRQVQSQPTAVVTLIFQTELCC